MSFSQMLSGEGVWMVIAATLIPAIGGIWWYIITKVSHIYSKLATAQADMAAKTEQIDRLKHDYKNLKHVVEWNSKKVSDMESDLNYLFWELNKKETAHEQSIQTKRSSYGQSPRRPKQP